MRWLETDAWGYIALIVYAVGAVVLCLDCFVWRPW